jgi:hypothetical protein
VNAVELLPAIRDIYSRHPEFRCLAAWELQHVLLVHRVGTAGPSWRSSARTSRGWCLARAYTRCATSTGGGG